MLYPIGSDGKDWTCNAGDLGLISVSGKSLERGMATHSSVLGASLVVQIVKNLPAMWETRVWSMCQEDALDKGMATHSSILAWTRGIHGITKSQTQLRDCNTHTHTHTHNKAHQSVWGSTASVKEEDTGWHESVWCYAGIIYHSKDLKDYSH